MRVAPAVDCTNFEAVIPFDESGGRDDLSNRVYVNDTSTDERSVFGGNSSEQCSSGSAVLAHDPLVTVRVLLIASVRTDNASDLSGTLVRGSRHQRSDSGGERAALRRVVGKPGCHQKRAKVRISDTQLTVVASGLRDRLGREIGERDRDLHRCDDELDCLPEQFRVEGTVAVAELHQVEARKVARRVVKAEILTARVTCRDATRLRVRVPEVDRVVILDARVSTLPSGLRHLEEERLRVNCVDDFAGKACRQTELGSSVDSLHELVGNTNRVVRVLVLDRDDVFAAEVHVETCVTENSNLLLLVSLSLDESLDVRVVNIEHNHLRGTPSSATGLDGPCARVSATHERDRAGSGPARRAKLFFTGTNAGKVDPRAGTAFEDAAFLCIPVQNRVHVVVHGEDEARARLLRG